MLYVFVRFYMWTPGRIVATLVILPHRDLNKGPWMCFIVPGKLQQTHCVCLQRGHRESDSSCSWLTCSDYLWLFLQHWEFFRSVFSYKTLCSHEATPPTVVVMCTSTPPSSSTPWIFQNYARSSSDLGVTFWRWSNQFWRKIVNCWVSFSGH